MRKTTRAKGLDKAQRAQIRALDEACRAAEPLFMKLNWDMLDTRPRNEVNDLLCYDDGELVGYLGLYDMGQHPPEIEMTGMVRPDCRRKGIFTSLFKEAVTISRMRGAERLLLVTERQSESGKLFAEQAGLAYSFSEYRMRCDAYNPLDRDIPDFALRPSVSADIPFLTALDTACFGSIFPGGYDRELEHLFIAVANGADIGKIGLIYDDGLGYIFGVAILPEFRGHGYGRAMLDAVLKIHFRHSPSGVILEVATQNDTALSLYRSVGFETLTVYDYYEKKLK